MVGHKAVLLSFLRKQRILVLATRDESLWVTNVYFAVSSDFVFYFISNAEHKHCVQTLKCPEVAFSVAWSNPVDMDDRKGIQGQGVCKPVSDEEEVRQAVKLLSQQHDEYFDVVSTTKRMLSKDNASCVWKIVPSFIKHWNDEVFKGDFTKDFNF